MDLSNFKVLDKAQYDALTEREQVKYELQYESYKENLAEAKAKKAAQEVINEMKLELIEQNKVQLDELSEANKKALAELAEKYDMKVEDLEAKLKQAKISEVKTRMATMSDEIMDKLSTEEGENLLKAFINGQAKNFKVDLEAKAMLTPAGGVAPQFTPVVGPGHDDIHARNVIPVFPTLADVIRYVQFTVDPAADGIGTVAPGELKPDMGYLSAVVNANVVKIAGLLDIADEMLDDVVGLRAWLAYELPKAYMDAEDLQIFKGDGTGENLLGLWYQADPQSFPIGSVTAASNTIDKIAAGGTEIRLLKRSANTAFVSPVEYMEIFINKGNTEEYTYPIVLDTRGNVTIAGIIVYWSNVFEEGTGIVGDFSRGAAIFQRKGMELRYSDQHKDNFARNVVTIRIEARIALPIYYPEAFKKLFNATT